MESDRQASDRDGSVGEMKKQHHTWGLELGQGLLKMPHLGSRAGAGPIEDATPGV